MTRQQRRKMERDEAKPIFTFKEQLIEIAENNATKQFNIPKEDSPFVITSEGNSISVVPKFMDIAKTPQDYFEGFAIFLQDERLLKSDDEIQKRIGIVLADVVMKFSKVRNSMEGFETIYSLLQNVEGIKHFLNAQNPIIVDSVFHELKDIVVNHEDELWKFLD